MNEGSATSRALRPISQKQLDYLPILRKRLLRVFGSQTPPEFLRSAEDRSLSLLTATVLISEMKRMLQEGTPPVREESTTSAPKSEGSGYEGGPVAPEPARESYISIYQQPLPDPGAMEYWGWAWTCSHPMHSAPVSGDVARREMTFLAALEHWGQYHLPED